MNWKKGWLESSNNIGLNIISTSDGKTIRPSRTLADKKTTLYATVSGTSDLVFVTRIMQLEIKGYPVVNTPSPAGHSILVLSPTVFRLKRTSLVAVVQQKLGQQPGVVRVLLGTSHYDRWPTV